MLAGTIPIYWGNPDIGREFNSAAFINCHDFPTLDDAAAYVKKVDEDDGLWCEIMSRPGKPRNRKPSSWKKRNVKQPNSTGYSTSLRKKRAARGTAHGCLLPALFKTRPQAAALAWRRLKNRLRH